MNRNYSRKLLRPFLLMAPRKRGVVVLTFHNILPENYYWFEEVINYLVHNYLIIDPNSLTDDCFLYKEKIKILITFDDGFYSNKLLTQEVLNKHSIKALFFVTEGFIDVQDKDCAEFCATQLFPNSNLDLNDSTNFLSMDWCDVKELVSQGHTIGAHTKSHSNLSQIRNYEEIFDEICISADRIEKKVGKKVHNFAIPFGGIDSITTVGLNLAKARFKHIFSNIRGNLNESPSKHFIFRQNIVPGDPIWLVKSMVECRLDWRFSGMRNKAMHRFKN